MIKHEYDQKTVRHIEKVQNHPFNGLDGIYILAQNAEIIDLFLNTFSFKILRKPQKTAENRKLIWQFADVKSCSVLSVVKVGHNRHY